MYRVSSFISIWAASKFTGFSSTGLESITIGKHIEHRIFKVAFFFGGKRKTTTYNIQEHLLNSSGGKDKPQHTTFKKHLLNAYNVSTWRQRQMRHCPFSQDTHGPILHGKLGEKVEAVMDFSWTPKSLQ